MKLNLLKKGIVAMACLPLALVAGNAAAAGWAPTATHVLDMSHASRIGDLSSNSVLHVAVSLKLRNKAELDALTKRIMDPADSMFRQSISHEEVVQKYFPLPEHAAAVADFLRQHGATNVTISSSNMLVNADITVANARSAFNTEFARFNQDGKEVFANTLPASVPSHIKDFVLSVHGLQSAAHLQPLHTIADAVTPNVSYLSPTALPKAYGVSTAGAGTNSTIGIITDGDMTQTKTDFATFLSKNGLPSFALTVKGPGGTDTAGTVEWNLDTQAVYGMSGGVKQLILYAGASLSDTDLANDFDLAVTDNAAKAVDASLGECESLAHSGGFMATADQYFQTAVAQGQTFFVSSGDGGSRTGCYSHTGFFVAVSYPASSPYVVSVGGTVLTTTSSGTYSSETAWSSGGGGKSKYEARPSWQNSVVTDTHRGVPDIAFVAAASIYYKGLATGVQGTSVSAPLAAGLWARVETAHSNSVGFGAPLIYGLPSADFHDVKSGSNGTYSAGTGWDYCTGFGSPVGDAYVNGL